MELFSQLYSSNWMHLCFWKIFFEGIFVKENNKRRDPENVQNNTQSSSISMNTIERDLFGDGNGEQPEMNILIFIFWIFAFALSVKKQMREFNLPSKLQVQIFLTKDMMKRIVVLSLLSSLSDFPVCQSTCSSRFSFERHNCIISQTQQVKCWGYGIYGRLGYGDTSSRGDNANEMSDYLPFVNVDGNVTLISAGPYHTCVHLSSFDVKCWGHNGYAQLGYGDTSSRGGGANEMGSYLPTTNFGPGVLVVDVTSGAYHNLILTDSGEIKAWGRNDYGQLGYGDTSNRGDLASQMGSYLPFVNVGSGRTANSIHGQANSNCVILDDLSVKCWGNNGYGQLGQVTSSSIGNSLNQMGDYLSPINFPSGVVVSSLGTGMNHVGMISSSRTLYTWGWNDNGQLGKGHDSNIGENANEMGEYLESVNVGSGRTVVEFQGGFSHSCVILDDYNVKCFGLNGSGQLGYEDTTIRGNSANEMGDYLSNVNLGSGLTAQSLHLGRDHSCVVLNDDSFKCFGDNIYGQLGIGHTNTTGDGENEMGNYLDPINVGAGVEIELCFDYSPTSSPTYDPTFDPTIDPTFDPTTPSPTFHPTFDPTFDPTYYPTFDPTFDPIFDPTFAPSFTSLQCEPGWNEVNGYCYSLLNAGQSWDEANSSCVADEGWLMSLQSDEEMEELDSWMDSYFIDEDIWIGLSDRNEENEFIWSYNGPLEFYNLSRTGYSNWGSSELDSSKNCTRLSHGDGWKWVETSCSLSLPFICQRFQMKQDNFIHISQSKGRDSVCTRSPHLERESPCYSLVGAFNKYSLIKSSGIEGILFDESMDEVVSESISFSNVTSSLLLSPNSTDDEINVICESSPCISFSNVSQVDVSFIHFVNGSSPPLSFLNSSASLSNLSISSNKGGIQGGGLHAQSSPLNLENIVIQGNEATFGGGIWISGEDSELNATNVKILNNEALIGGGVYYHYPTSSRTIVRKDHSVSYPLSTYSPCDLDSFDPRSLFEEFEIDGNEAILEETGDYGTNPCEFSLVNFSQFNLTTGHQLESDNMEGVLLIGRDSFGNLLYPSNSSFPNNEVLSFSANISIYSWSPSNSEFIDRFMLPFLHESELEISCWFSYCNFSLISIASPPGIISLKIELTPTSSSSYFSDFILLHNISIGSSPPGMFVSNSSDDLYSFQDCSTGAYSNERDQSECEECQVGEGFSLVEGSTSCSNCDCNGRGVCESTKSALCTCDPLFFGDFCQDRQNLEASFIFGFVLLSIVLVSVVPMLCWGSLRLLSKRTRKKLMDPLLLKLFGNTMINKWEMTGEINSNHLSLEDNGEEVQMIENPLHNNLIEEEEIFPMDYPPPSFQESLRAIPEFFHALSIFVGLLLFLYMFETLKVLGNVFLMGKSLYQSDVETFSKILDQLGEALSTLLDPIYLGWISDIFLAITNFILEINLTEIAIQQIDVTCKGTQAPGSLFVNLFAIIGLVMLIELQFFPFVKITLRSYIDTSKKRSREIGKSMVWILIIGSFVGVFEGLLRYVAQLLASFMTYSDFFPSHSSTKLCDAKFNGISGLDTLLAQLSTCMAYVFFLPAIHTVLCVFIPGVPCRVSFPKTNWSLKGGFEIVERNQEESKNQVELVDLTKIKARERLSMGHDSILRDSLSERKSMINSFSNNQNEVPSFIRVLFLMFKDLINCDFKFTKSYLRSMWWKIKSLFKMTVGYWDEELIRGFRIKERTSVFDDDLDDEEYHLDMIALFGQSHSLIWQFAHSTVVISKFAEAMNGSPLFVKYQEGEELEIEPLKVQLLDETTSSLPSLFRKLRNLHLMFGGRIWRCIFELMRFVVEVSLALSPHYLIILIYWALILPEMMVLLVNRWNEMFLKFPNLRKLLYFWGNEWSRNSIGFLLPLLVLFSVINFLIGISLGKTTGYDNGFDNGYDEGSSNCQS